MKKNVVRLIGILAAMSLTACSNKPEVSDGDVQDVQTDTVIHIPQNSKEADETDTDGKEDDETDADGKEDGKTDADGKEDGKTDADGKEDGETDADGKEDGETDAGEKEDTVYDVLDRLVGEYSYTSDDSIGRLVIQKTSDGYDISDYESETSYRFLVDSSNIQTIENNKIYIEYPELLLSDDTVHFSYYILEYGTDGIDVYYGMTEPENAEFLYHAVRQNSGNMKHEGDGHPESETDGKFIDFEALGIKEYEYPPEFIMGDNLKTALAQLACSYSSFDSGTPMVGDWKQYFIDNFIQNSRLTFDYLDLISEQNDGLISIDELNYIQYSLTNTELDFSGFAGHDIIRYEAASPVYSGSITRFDYKDTDNGVLITADLEERYDGAEDVQKYEITAELVRNPYSCFDGYSIAALSSTMAEPT